MINSFDHSDSSCCGDDWEDREASQDQKKDEGWSRP